MTAGPYMLRPRSIAALSAAQIGVWEFDGGEGLQYFDKAAATFLGFAEREARLGIPVERVRARVHNCDRITGADGRLLIATHGGLYTHIFRCGRAGEIERQAIVHGHVETDDAGAVRFSSGVLVDVTGRLSGAEPHQPAWPDDASATPLEQAADAALCAHRAIKDLGAAARPSLLYLTEMLLHELGMQLAQRMR